MIRIALLAALWVLPSCGDESTTGPVEPAWDRDACEHCRMVVSDRRFAAQVRSATTGKVLHFDDPGCAILAGVGDQDEVWVRDPSGSEWLDGRKVRFSSGHKTPMSYGFGVAAEGTDGLDWAAMTTEIQERESARREHAHP
ncbi:MAG: hypothetical protein OEP95_02250 [Myxococcales bacterium]|nr:hypothetical protein [Myxococcales bacterium]